MRPTPSPTVEHLAPVMHLYFEGTARRSLLWRSRTPDTHVTTLGLPAEADQPADALIGFVAPRSCEAIALCTSAIDPDPLRRRAGGVASLTFLQHRSGWTETILQDVPGPPLLAGPTPPGLTVDAMTRVLGAASPPPGHGPATWFEALWVDRLADGILDHPDTERPWSWLADRHPLAGVGTATPAVLAARTRQHRDPAGWASLRSGAEAVVESYLGWNRPRLSGEMSDAATWFDDGSYCRWVMSKHGPTELILDGLLGVLSPRLGLELCRSLTTVAGVEAIAFGDL